MIKDEDMHYLNSNVSIDETKSALFSMRNYKLPGPDGFHPLFFKSQWEVVGISLHNLVVDCFAHPNRISKANQTVVTLIPKCDIPNRVSQFRPISLCNVAYKVVTKIITQRLRCIMPYVVSENQSNFVPGRATSDNILVLHEVIHSLNQLKGKKGYMDIKMDLEKAYDRLEWDFVLETLLLLNIPT